MIGYLNGSVLEHDENPILLDVHGVGYRVHIPQALFSSIQSGQPCSLYIYTHIAETAFDLYGFATKKDLFIFRLLLGVSGIGPKIAAAVVSHGSAAVADAVATADTAFFSSVPRLGKKNAQKIIIELKSKLGSIEELDLKTHDSSAEDILEALVSMGFDRRESITVLQSFANQDMTLEQKMKAALKKLGDRS